MSEILQLQSVSRRFGGLQALRDVSLTVNKGEVIGLIGRTARARPRWSTS
jgi:amino acid/amide ABC transporter ATP-binding protein 1, HAAT family (TC 3.A.1.4.-)